MLIVLFVCFVRLSVVGSGAEGDLSVDCFVCLFC